MLKRNPEDVKESVEFFNRGVESVKVLVKWNPWERLEESAEFKEAVKVQKLLKEEGLRKEEVFELEKSKVEMKEELDEESASWKEWLLWNLTDSRNVQLLYLLFFMALLLDPIFNFFGFFAAAVA